MLQDYWHIACRSKELKASPLKVKLFSKHIVLFRNKLGEPCALENRCAHRNMPLHCGSINNGNIECPYHGWQFDGEGNVVDIPVMSSDEKESYRIRATSYPVKEQQGYIWICTSGNPVEVKPPEFPHMSEPGWTTFHMKTRFNATVENCLENFLDVPHATFVHKFWFRSPNKESIKAIITELQDGAVAEYIAEPRKKSLMFGLLSNSKTQLKHTDRFIAPSMSRVDYQFSDNKHYIISSFCSPVTDSKTNVYTVMTFKYGKVGSLVRLLFEPLSRLIIKQDVKVLNQQQKNIEKFSQEKFTLIPQDLLRAHIIRWRQAMKSGTTPDLSKENNIEVKLNV